MYKLNSVLNKEGCLREGDLEPDTSRFRNKLDIKLSFMEHEKVISKLHQLINLYISLQQLLTTSLKKENLTKDNCTSFEGQRKSGQMVLGE